MSRRKSHQWNRCEISVLRRRRHRRPCAVMCGVHEWNLCMLEQLTGSGFTGNMHNVLIFVHITHTTIMEDSLKMKTWSIVFKDNYDHYVFHLSVPFRTPDVTLHKELSSLETWDTRESLAPHIDAPENFCVNIHSTYILFYVYITQFFNNGLN